MVNTKKKTDDQLKYIIQDCSEAIAANPSGHKAMDYLLELRACERELSARETLRIIRRGTSGNVYDPLYCETPRGRKYARKYRNSDYDRDRHRSACFQAGWYRKYGLV